MVEMADIPVESLVPEPLRALKGGDEYMARLPEFDKEMEVGGREGGGGRGGGGAGQEGGGRVEGKR